MNPIERRPYRVLAVAAVAALLMVVPLAAVDTVSAPTPWKAVAASGAVEALPVQAESAWLPLKRGDRLEPASSVRTGRRGRATLARHGDIVIVDPESQVELPGSLTAGDESSVIQTSGSVVYEVHPREGRDFKVFTPYLVAGVKGTTFLVTVTDSSASVTVEEGLVEVSSRSTGESFDVGPGESVRLDAMADAEMEHVSLNVKVDRRDGESDSELRRLARADLRRLGRAVAQRDELILDDLDLPETGSTPGHQGPGGIDPVETLQEDLDDDLRLATEELEENLSGDQSRKSKTGQTPNQQ